MPLKRHGRQSKPVCIFLSKNARLRISGGVVPDIVREILLQARATVRSRGIW